MSDIDAVEWAAAHWAVDSAMSTLAMVLGVDFGPHDFDSVHVGLGLFMVATISGAVDEVEFFGGAS